MHKDHISKSPPFVACVTFVFITRGTEQGDTRGIAGLCAGGRKVEEGESYEEARFTKGRKNTREEEEKICNVLKIIEVI